MNIASLGEEGYFGPARIAAALATSGTDLARTAGLGRDAVQRRDRVRSDKVQGRLREVVEVIDRATPRLGSELMAYA